MDNMLAIEANDMALRLFSDEAFTDAHKESVLHIQTTEMKWNELLNIVKRRNRRDFGIFLSTLLKMKKYVYDAFIDDGSKYGFCTGTFVNSNFYKLFVLHFNMHARYYVVFVEKQCLPHHN